MDVCVELGFSGAAVGQPHSQVARARLVDQSWRWGAFSWSCTVLDSCLVGEVEGLQ